ncbi:unknown [Clostridium sp. CAG:1219]|nr:unknown [Clostridium sp. CAG:1219]
MLDKEKLIKLNSNMKYDEIREIFLFEYKEIIEKLLISKGIDVKNNTLLDDINELKQIENGKYKNEACEVLNMLYDEDMEKIQQLRDLIDNYNYISSKLKS